MHPPPGCHLEANLCHGHFFADQPPISVADFFLRDNIISCHLTLSCPPWHSVPSPSVSAGWNPTKISSAGKKRFHLTAKKIHLLVKGISSCGKKYFSRKWQSAILLWPSPGLNFNYCQGLFANTFLFLVGLVFASSGWTFKATESLQMIYNQQAVHQLSGFVSLPKLSNDRKGADQAAIEIKCKDQYLLLHCSNSSCQSYTTATAAGAELEMFKSFRWKKSSTQSQRHSSLNTASFSTFSKWSNPLVVVDHPT